MLDPGGRPALGPGEARTMGAGAEERGATGSEPRGAPLSGPRPGRPSPVPGRRQRWSRGGRRRVVGREGARRSGTIEAKAL